MADAIAPRFVLPYQTVVDGAGVPLPGAQLFFYISGTDTPQNTYADAALDTPNSNPVVANAAGVFPNIFLESALYKVVLTDYLGNQIWTADPVTGGAGGTGGGGKFGIKTVIADYTIAVEDFTILVNAAAASVNVTLPAPSTVSGQIFNIKRLDSSANFVDVIGMIDVVSDMLLQNQYSSIEVQSDGTQYWLLGKV